MGDGNDHDASCVTSPDADDNDDEDDYHQL